MTTNIEIVRSLYDRFERGDVDGALAMFADDAEIEFIGPKSIPFAGSYRGAKGMGEALEKLTSTCDMLDFGPDELHAEGEFVTVLAHERARSKATGREWETPLVDTFVVQEGKIKKFRCMYDTAAVADAYRGDASPS